MEQARTVDLAETPGLAITHSLGEDVGKYLYDVPAVAPTPTDAGERVNRRRDAA
jgi:hypothetical protein